MKRKVIMFVYGDITTDARVQRAADSLSENFDLTLISLNKNKTIKDQNFKNILINETSRNNVINYFKTIYESKKIIERESPDIVYGHDYFSPLLIYLLKNKLKNTKFIYDAHELIIPDSKIKESLRNKFFRLLERKIISKIDLLVCTNEERAKLMKGFYNLTYNPLIIRNISLLKKNKEVSNKEINQNLEIFFSKPGITLVYAGVITNDRKLDNLIKAIGNEVTKFKLLIVGDGPSYNELKIKCELSNNLIYLFTGKVPYQSLGTILSKCDIGFIYYPNDTLNNIYCASNKLYEYASIDLPILANENPTITKFLDKYKIGIATNDFHKGLKILANNLQEFKSNCGKFIEENQWKNESKKLLEYIKVL